MRNENYKNDVRLRIAEMMVHFFFAYERISIRVGGGGGGGMVAILVPMGGRRIFRMRVSMKLEKLCFQLELRVA